MYTKIAFAAVAIATLSACSISPKDYETTPVIAQSPLGPVTCQIYTHEQVTWDRSINRPAGLDVVSADNTCRLEGRRIMEGGTPNYAPTVGTSSAAL